MPAGIPPEAIINALVVMAEARQLIERADPLYVGGPGTITNRLGVAEGELRGYLIANSPERIQLRAA